MTRKAKLHLTNYDRLGENRKTTRCSVNFDEIPKDRQYLLITENGKITPYFVTNTYIPVGTDDDTTVHVFATRTSVPYQEAEKVGIKGDDLGMPSLTSFDGHTVADLMSFLSQFPAEMGVVFQDDQVLVAKPKDVLILRLDQAEEHQ